MTPVCGGSCVQRIPAAFGLTAVQVTVPSVAVVATVLGDERVGKTGFRLETKGLLAPVVPYPVTTQKLPKASATCSKGLIGDTVTPSGEVIFWSGWGFGPPLLPPMLVAPHVP